MSLMLNDMEGGIIFRVTNNIAEYEALLHGLRLTVSSRIRQLYIRGDFKIVVNHEGIFMQRSQDGSILSGDS